MHLINPTVILLSSHHPASHSTSHCCTDVPKYLFVTMYFVNRLARTENGIYPSTLRRGIGIESNSLEHKNPSALVHHSETISFFHNVFIFLWIISINFEHFCTANSMQNNCNAYKYYCLALFYHILFEALLI